MGQEQSYTALNVYPETAKRVRQIKTDNRLGSMNDVVEILLEAYDAAGENDHAVDESDLAREVAARIDYEDLARKTADNIRDDLR